MLPDSHSFHSCDFLTRLSTLPSHPIVHSRPCQRHCRGFSNTNHLGLVSECHNRKQSQRLRCSSQQPTRAFGKGDDPWPQRDRLGLPTQGDAIVRGGLDEPSRGTQVQERPKPPPDIDYLQELLAMQQNGPKNIGFFGTRNMGFMHQNLIEILSYAMVLTGNHIHTSGATGTNAAVIKGALRAEKPELLTVVLPQSRSKQPPESQEMLQQVQHVIEMPNNNRLSLGEASRICNNDIISRVQQVICFAFHDSRLLLETCEEAQKMRKIVTLFYLD
ncbi:hypothetical protein WJX74_009089 [Apatococcus lobatus]|uniref:Cyanobacteria-specific protein n=1 Tax=Apatococcus lobatus TaxID=904363 RepID=A0AAW1R3V6_9CHLO